MIAHANFDLSVFKVIDVEDNVYRCAGMAVVNLVFVDPMWAMPSGDEQIKTLRQDIVRSLRQRLVAAAGDAPQ